MMKIIIPFIIFVGIVLTKLSALRSSVLVILSEMTHFLSSLIDLLVTPQVLLRESTQGYPF
jgi:hypothetical protein